MSDTHRSTYTRLATISCAVIVAGILLGGLLGGCAGGPLVPDRSARSQETTPITELQKVEVQQYKGEDLSSVGDFRENSIKGPQYVDIADYRLTVGGKVSDPQTLTYADVLLLPPKSKVVRLNCVEGWSVDILWEGVLIRDLLEKAGYDPAAKVVIFRAYDGYSSSLPLDYVLDRNLILAYKQNGQLLHPARGFPFQVVAEDQWGYKWVKWVTAIEVSDDEGFRGFWESRGYDNDATLPSAKGD